ncbi:hypothetical protein E2562_029379 [Oryza meyeriana var. granulata]|uniref:Uncharacterized protein n=1 Tax=Oryza meyeriana var. granulata TaxID=110450 RepID=A0A6G1C0B5_9ORYZ|nr:hypothetical protein E2562_029379 [Oryza meyeriana var. granulata]
MGTLRRYGGLDDGVAENGRRAGDEATRLAVLRGSESSLPQRRGVRGPPHSAFRWPGSNAAAPGPRARVSVGCSPAQRRVPRHGFLTGRSDLSRTIWIWTLLVY